MFGRNVRRKPVAVAVGALGALAIAMAADAGRQAPAPPGTLAFISDRSSNRGGEIYSVRATGGGRRSLSRGPLVADYGATPTPDRRKLAFVSSRGGAWGIWVTSTGPGRPLRVARLKRPPVEQTIDWSPDGRSLVYDLGMGEGDLHEVWTATPRRRISRRGWRPDWSPRGDRIAYQTSSGHEKAQVVVVTPHGRVLWRRPGSEPAWSPDGRLIAYLTPRLRLALATPAGRVVGHIERFVEGFGWWPGGRQLVVFGRRPWLFTTGGRLVRTLPQVDSLVAADDGARIAYVSRGDLVVAPLRGRARRIASARSIAFLTDWSPDGRRILALQVGARPRIVAIRVDGGRMSTVAGEPPGSAISAFWQGNSRVILESYGARGGDLYVRPPGGGVRRLARTNGQYAFPRWSPDGTRIAATAIPLCEMYCPAELVVVDAATGRATPLTHGPQNEDLPYAQSASWSPDGKWIAFERTGPAGFSIRVVPAAGGSERELFRPAENAFATSPAWSPDGSQLAFLAEEEVVVVDADGSDAHTIASTEPGAQSTVWSPDGRQIAWRVGNTITVVVADGSAPPAAAVRLPQLACGMQVESNPPGLAWSGDGARFVFGGCGGPGSLPADLDLWSVQTDGKGLRRLTSSVAPDWGPTLR